MFKLYITPGSQPPCFTCEPRHGLGQQRQWQYDRFQERAHSVRSRLFAPSPCPRIDSTHGLTAGHMSTQGCGRALALSNLAAGAAGAVLLTMPTWLHRWFFFRVSGAKDKDLIMHLVNAGSSSFPEAWEGYQACSSCAVAVLCKRACCVIGLSTVWSSIPLPADSR